MNKKIPLLLLILSLIHIKANDGAFYAKGNQLIPINETEISIKKEILTLKKIRNQYLEVTVYYEFYNPSKKKTITVGFEAFSPQGDIEGAPKDGKHPYMRDFTVEFNNSILNYEVAYVSDTLYNQNGKINPIDFGTFEGATLGNYVDFYYVYHFNTTFKKGKNIIKHTYNFDLSKSVDIFYNFEYVLTAANRWANKQIDDFTLIIDHGEFETFYLNQSFYQNPNEWLINGIGKLQEVDNLSMFDFNNKATLFHIQKGNIIFQKKDFKPKGELLLYSLNYYSSDEDNYDHLPFSYYQNENITNPKNDFQKKILQNLPFARRGYIFKNESLQLFFEKMDWYIPNPNYTPNSNLFSDIEKKWLEKWK